MLQSLFTEPLAQVVRSITLQKRSGILRVEQLGAARAERGEIYFENGELVRARTAQEHGQPALQRIKEWKQVTCTFQGVSRSPFGGAQTRQLQPGELRGSHLLAPARSTVVVEATKVILPPARQPEEARRPFLSQLQIEARMNIEPPLTDARMKIEPPLTDGLQRAVQPQTDELLRAARPQTERLIRQTDSGLGQGQPQSPAAGGRATAPLDPRQAAILKTLPTIPPTPRLGPLPGLETLPGREAIFKSRLLASPARAIQQMERQARVIFILLDGQRTIQDIARLTHRAESEVEQILMDLTRRGFTQYLRG